MILDEELYMKITNETLTDYEGWLNKDKEEYFVTCSNVIGMLEDLVCEIEHWKEQYEDLKQDMYQNYKFVGDTTEYD